MQKPVRCQLQAWPLLLQRLQFKLEVQFKEESNKFKS